MRHKHTPTEEDLDVYEPLTPEERKRIRRRLTKNKGRFGHHVEIDLPLTNALCTHNEKPKG